MAIQFKEADFGWQVLLDGKTVLTIPVPEGCHDSFELINDKAFYWRRKTDKPVTQMKLTLQASYKPRYFQIPAVNYNGNGWGSGAQYSGYGCAGEPWIYTLEVRAPSKLAVILNGQNVEMTLQYWEKAKMVKQQRHLISQM